LGQHTNPTERHCHFALSRLLSPEDFVRYDQSGMGTGTDRVAHQAEHDEDAFYTHAGRTYHPGDGQVGVVRDLDFEFFRGRLVEHFDILFKQQKIVWPARK
jgi:hypothetical protein